MADSGAYKGNISEADLLAYADGRLDDDPVRKALVERQLQPRPGLRASLMQDSRIIERIRAHYQPALDEPAPQALLKALHRRPMRLTTIKLIGAAGAGAAAAMTAAAIPAWMAASPDATKAGGDIPALVLERNGGGVFPDLGEWTLKRVEATSRTDGRAPLRAIYEQDGRILTLSINRAQADLTEAEKSTETAVLSWTSGALAYALDGDVTAEESREIAKLTQQDETPEITPILAASDAPSPDVLLTPGAGFSPISDTIDIP